MSQKDDDSTPVVGASSENSDLTGLSLDPAGNEETARIAELSGKMSADDLDEGPEDAQQVAESSHQGFMNGDEYRKGKEEGETPAAKAEEIQDEAKGLEEKEKEKEKEEGYGEDNAARLGHHLEDREAKGTNQEPSKYSGPSDLRSNNGYGKEGHPNSMDYFSDQRTSQPHTDVDLLHNSATRNEEGRSRQRILAFASKRYAQAVERNPEDYDALYNWALVLQESADNLSAEDTGGPGKDQLLEEACKKYQEATRLCPTLHEAFYNWAIAVADRAKMRRRTKEAEELWKQACKNYERAVQLHWSSPQALNNWGLALQELSGIVAVRDKQLIVRTAIKKFRAAIQLQFDFHRAIYNLGTVLYGLAEDMFRSGRQGAAKESTPSDLYSQSAVYIAAAHALKPEYPVYRSALRLVRSMLPLPYLKTGYLIVPPDGDALAPHIDWKRLWFVLDQEAIYQMEKVEQKSLGQSPSKWMGSTASDVTGNLVDTQPVARVEVSKISHLSTCSDLSLPPGGGFCIDTVDGQQYFVAETWEAVDGWVDAIRLVYTIFVKGQSGVLGGILGG